jgi:pilus assembly protein FimV
MEAMAEEAMSGLEGFGDSTLTEEEAAEAEALSDLESFSQAAAEQIEEPLEATPSMEAPLEEGEEESSFDLDLSSLESGEETGETAAESAEEEALTDMDLDLSSLEDMTTEEEPGLDFDTSGLDQMLEEPATPPAEAETFDLDMSALEETAAETTEPAPEDTGLDFDLGGEGAAAEEETAADLTESSTDEVATKLDLARAYIDMGDPDGARSILEEVTAEGNDQQKQEAQELIGQL